MITAELRAAASETRTGIALLFGHRELSVAEVKDGELFLPGVSGGAVPATDELLADVYEARFSDGRVERRVVDAPARTATVTIPDGARTRTYLMAGTVDRFDAGWAVLRDPRTRDRGVPTGDIEVSVGDRLVIEVAVLRSEPDEHGNVFSNDEALVGFRLARASR